MPDNVIKTDIQEYWRRSYVGDKEIPSSSVLVDGEEKSRVFVGDKEANIVFVGDKVAYAKHKDNLVNNAFANKSNSVTFNLNNGSHKITRSMSVSDNYIGLKNTEAISIGDKITISFDVTDFYSHTNAHWNFYSAELGNDADTKFVIDHIGHYSKSGLAIRNRAALAGCSIIDDVSGECTMAEGDYFIIKNIKLERNIVDTEYSLAPSVTNNRVKIGKHWYNTCTIGSQQWLSENLNEDLKGVVAKDVDWRCALQSGVILTNVDLGSTITLSRNSSVDWYSCWFPVSEGETITYGGYGAYNASVVCLLDAENKLLWKSNSDNRDYNQTKVVPSGAVTCLFQSKESVENYGKPGQCIQSTHTSEGTWEGYYNNDASYGVKGYGKLYTWDCICSGNETPSAAMAKLLKDGWRVPTKADFDTLLATSGVTRNKLCEKWYWDVAGTNESGFSCIASGNRTPNGNFANENSYALIFSSTLINSGMYRINFSSSANEVSVRSTEYGMSVRLVRDVPATVATLASVDGTATIVNN